MKHLSVVLLSACWWSMALAQQIAPASTPNPDWLNPAELQARLFFSASEREQLRMGRGLLTTQGAETESKPQLLQLDGIISSNNPRQHTSHRILLKTNTHLPVQTWQVQGNRLRLTTKQGDRTLSVGESLNLANGEMQTLPILSNAGGKTLRNKPLALPMNATASSQKITSAAEVVAEQSDSVVLDAARSLHKAVTGKRLSNE